MIIIFKIFLLLLCMSFSAAVGLGLEKEKDEPTICGYDKYGPAVLGIVIALVFGLLAIFGWGVVK